MRPESTEKPTPPPTPPRRYFQAHDKYDGEPVRGTGFTAATLISYPVAATLAAATAFVLKRYHVANPAQYIVRTGLGVRDVSISKKALQWPLQRVARISMQPLNYTFSLHAMSKEKMEFVLPGVFTVGPASDLDALRRYAMLMTSNVSDLDVGLDVGLDGNAGAADAAHLSSIIKGVVEGETRVLAASLEIEEIFESRDKFRQRILDTVQHELSGFGLCIYNANIKELEDAPGSEYFVHARQRKRADAENVARKDIADATFRGDVAVKQKETETRVQRAQFEASAVLSENARAVEIAQSRSDMEIQKAEFTRLADIARIEATKMTEIRNMELLRDLERRVVEQQLEHTRSTTIVQATVDAEAVVKAADAALYRASKEADAILLKYDAQADGLRNLLSCAPDPHTVLQYSMIDRGVFQALAAENAKAINGLAPKIWVTGGSGGGSGGGVGDAIGGIMRSLPPLLTTLYEQTGIKPPSWAVDMDSAVVGADVDKCSRFVK